MDATTPSGAAGRAAGRTLVILNPAAGHDDPERLRRRIGAAFERRGAPFELVLTEGPGHATRLARSAVELGYRAVAVAGGDGTLAEVASGVAGTRLPIAIIPRGTGNQVASNLEIPRRLDDAVDVAVHGVPAPMDLGTIDGRYFALAAGAGLDAAVMAAATRDMKERFGFGAYLYAAVKEALAARPASFRLVVDERPLEVSAVSVIIANTAELFAGSFPFALPLAPSPAGSWRDGLFDVVIIAPASLTGLARVLWLAARREFSGDDRLLHLQARRITIEADPPLPVQIDGDPAGTTPVTASIQPDALSILVPAATGGGEARGG